MMQLKTLIGGETIWVSYKCVHVVAPKEGGCRITLSSGVRIDVARSCKEIIELIKSF